MAKKVDNSAVNKGKGKASLDHWYGPAQHVGEGISSDPSHESIPKGTLKSDQYKKS